MLKWSSQNKWTIPRHKDTDDSLQYNFMSQKIMCIMLPFLIKLKQLKGFGWLDIIEIYYLKSEQMISTFEIVVPLHRGEKEGRDGKDTYREILAIINILIF